MIVSKFGGAALGDADAIRRAVRVIRDRESDRPLVVTSALAGVTDRLLELERDSAPAQAVDGLLDWHERIGAELGLEAAELARLRGFVTPLSRWLATGRGDEWGAEERDRLTSLGELWSSRLLTGALRAEGLAADWVDARHFMLTDDRFGEAVVERAEMARRSRRFLTPLLARGRIPVTQGFLGVTDDGRTTTLGRGGSDYSASVLAAALAAERVEIWTDVDGIMTADPRIVPAARALSRASYDEAADLAAFGARVPHAASHAPLADAGIPCLVKNSWAPERPGTRIDDLERADSDRLDVRSVALKSGITILGLRAAPGIAGPGFLRGVAQAFARRGIGASVLTSSDRSASVTVDQRDCGAALTHELESLARVTRYDGRAVVGVVGTGFRAARGLSGRLLDVVRHVDPELISQGGSETSLALVVREADGEEAVRRLHAEFVER